MAKYGAYFDNYTVSANPKSGLALHTDAAGELAEIIEIIATGSGTTAPADVQFTCRFVRATNATPGTSTAQTPEPFDGKSAASYTTCGVEFSVEPGALASVYPILFGHNQRGGMRWGVPRGEGV